MTDNVLRFLADLATAIGIIIAALGTVSILNRIAEWWRK